MPLTAYTKTLTLLAAPITGITGPVPHPVSVTAGGDVYPTPGAWTRWPVVGDWLVQLPSGELAWWPALTMTDLALNPLAGPFNVGDKVVCPREYPLNVMVVASIVAGGYTCTSNRTLNRMYFLAADLQAAP